LRRSTIACRLPGLLLGTLLLAVSGSALATPDPPEDGPAPRRCPTVDRDSPTDGVTTITVLSPEAPCTAGGVWTGWNCVLLQSTANENGAAYRLDIRWNRVGQSVRGSCTFMNGSDATRSLRELPPGFGQQAQDNLDAASQIRSIDIVFQGTGTEAQPRNGYPNISSVYADALEWLVTNGIATGVKVHYGNSGGSLMGAFSLAYHNTDQLLDGIVTGGGPFWGDMHALCAEPASPYYGSLGTRGRADSLNWTDLNGTTPCTHGRNDEDPRYDCRSLLGSTAQTDYPGLRVAVIIGTADVNNPWITASAEAWLDTITVENKSIDKPSGVAHQVLGSSLGASTAEQRINEIVNAGPAPQRQPLPVAGALLELPAPNPVRDTTLLPFSLARSGPTTLTIHDVAGRRIATLIDGDRPRGRQTVLWDGRTDAGPRAAPGVYFVRLRADGTQRVAKIQVSPAP
jgi:hypothetical protein